MNAVTALIRARAQELLSRGEVDLVIGYARGALPMLTKPVFVRSPEEAKLLWWDDFCVMNLVNFVPTEPSGRVAIVAKGCDARSLVVCHRENRVDMSSMVVLGIPCTGMLDAAKIHRAIGASRIVLDVGTIDENSIRICGDGFQEILDRQDNLRDVCRGCRYPNPVAFDMLCEEENPKLPDRDIDVWRSLMQPKGPAERQAFFERMFHDCITCLACRQSCPLCYCDECFLDKVKADWLRPGDDGRIDSVDFHMTRAFHLAGRCTDCGACESACPMNIPVRTLTRMLSWDIEKNHSYEAGIGGSIPDRARPFQPSTHEPER